MPAFDEPAIAPPSAETRLAQLALARSPRVGTVTFRRLVATYGDPVRALERLPEHAARGGLRGYRPVDMDRVCAEIDHGAQAGAELLLLGQPGYPSALGELGDAPVILWMRGRLPGPDRDAVGIVGARNSSALGRRMATRLAQGLGALGYVTVSGLARGIDTEVHAATLDTGTIAVMAGGIDTIYPAQNSDLAHAIVERGALLTEAPPGLQPAARHFPKRNRIIAGLSRAVLLVEAAERSGSLITARMALDQGREVMAVPGHPLDARAAGCNRLIREGATLVRDADDVAEALSPPIRQDAFAEAACAPPVPPLAEQPMPDDLRTRLLDLISPAPVAEDDLIRTLRVPPPQVLGLLLDMELAGLVDRHPGGFVARAV
ncbi:DNA-processing protein DprA [Roseobacter sp. HKCCA0434]|uniref:DNA-processing protein DprA n=1 Tax=Roseobacter sp. HKCCA0434 TaxID=3079297 RepID=UPI002905AB29|nr:DNA-processing protein DprA [Roseobacter sp. HKCCA0434]